MDNSPDFDPGDFDDSPEDRFGFDELFALSGEGDVFRTDDIVPLPDDSDAFEESDGIPDNNETDIPPSHPWKSKHVHFLDKMLVDGDDADPAVYETVAQLRKTEAAQWHLRSEALSKLVTSNEEYEEVIAHTQLALAGDFGLEVSRTPLYIVRENTDSTILHPAITASIVNGSIVIKHDDPTREIFGDQPLLLTILEAGAVARTRDKHIVTAAYGSDTILNWYNGRKFDVQVLSLHDLREISVDEKQGIISCGDLFERGFTASYAIRNTDEPFHNHHIGGRYEIHASPADRGMTVFTDGVEPAPRYDPKTDRLNVPWRYCFAFAVDEGQRVYYRHHQHYIAAYGIDLLDEHLPGLYQQMMKAHEIPGLKERIRERIDGVEPGLYARLAAAPDTFHGLREGTKMIIQALGIADEPLPPPSLV